MRITPWPNPGCVSICAKTRDTTLHDSFKNPFIGWAVVQDGQEHFCHKKLKKAKAWAEARFPEIFGWENQTPRQCGHQTYSAKLKTEKL